MTKLCRDSAGRIPGIIISIDDKCYIFNYKLLAGARPSYFCLESFTYWPALAFEFAGDNVSAAAKSFLRLFLKVSCVIDS
jgi:hypothetical protein